MSYLNILPVTTITDRQNYLIYDAHKTSKFRESSEECLIFEKPISPVMKHLPAIRLADYQGKHLNMPRTSTSVEFPLMRVMTETAYGTNISNHDTCILSWNSPSIYVKV